VLDLDLQIIFVEPGVLSHRWVYKPYEKKNASKIQTSNGTGGNSLTVASIMGDLTTHLLWSL